MLEWAVPEGADLDNPRVVKRANPLRSITVETIRADRASLSDIAFKRFTANQWVETEAYWLPPGAWQACAADYEIAGGEEVWVGVDIGGKRSMTAVLHCTEDLRVGVWTGQGDEAVIAARDRIRELAGRFEVRRVAFDPHNFQQGAAELAREGIRMREFPQSDARMSPASERLYAAVVEKRLRHPGDPVLDAHVAAAVAKQTERAWRLSKIGSRTQIDAVVALAMAVDQAETAPRGPRLIGWLG
jgi:phage terminase large subunit-like protein